MTYWWSIYRRRYQSIKYVTIYFENWHGPENSSGAALILDEPFQSEKLIYSFMFVRETEDMIVGRYAAKECKACNKKTSNKK